MEAKQLFAERSRQFRLLFEKRAAHAEAMQKEAVESRRERKEQLSAVKAMEEATLAERRESIANLAKASTEKKDRNDWFYGSLIGAILPKRGWRQSSYYSGIRELTTTTRQSITRSSSTCSFSCSSSTRSTAASSLGRSMCIVVYLTQGGSRGRLSSTRIQ